MATVIQIKRSANITAPSTVDLAEGELAYSQDSSNNGANAKLYIEALDSGASPVIHAIGGKYYTDVVDGATENNTANKLVKRDASGNFSATTVTANVIGNVSGNLTGNVTGDITGNVTGSATSANIASYADVLTTPRNITLAGYVTGNALFNGSQDITITVAANATSESFFTIEGDSGTDVFYTDNVLRFDGGEGLIASVSATNGNTDVSFALTTTGVAASTYGGTTNIPVIVVDAQGRITSASNTTISTSFTLAADTGSNDTFNTGDVLRVAGGTGIDTAVTDNTFSIALETTGVAASTYGGTTNIPVIEVDATGRIITASNASISTDLTVTGNTGSDTVSLSSENLNVVGGVGITTSVASNTISIVNTGATSVDSGGYGITVSSTTGAVSVTNSGVTRLESGGHGIALDANNGNVTVTNNGVTAITGTAGEISVSGATGNITIGLPDDVTIGRDLSVTGNLYVTGNVVALPVENLVLEDSLIQLANNNITTDIIDIGFYGSYNSDGGEHEHAGLFRDASDSGRFKLFEGLQGNDNLTTTINVTGPGFSVATLVANLTGGTVSGLTANITVGDGGTGRGTLTTNAVLYGQGTSAVGLATGTAGQVLQLNGSGVPVFAGIDGGSF